MSWNNKTPWKWLIVAISLLGIAILIGPCEEESKDKESWLWDRNWQALQYVPASSELELEDAEQANAPQQPNIDISSSSTKITVVGQPRFVQEKVFWQQNKFYVELDVVIPKQLANAEAAEASESQTSTISYPANSEIFSLFSNFAHPTIEAAYPATDELLEKTGLSSPKGTIQLKDQAYRVSISLGDAAPNNRIYIGSNNNREIVLIQKNIVDSLLDAKARAYISFSLIEELKSPQPWQSLHISVQQMGKREQENEPRLKALEGGAGVGAQEQTEAEGAQAITLNLHSKTGEDEQVIWQFANQTQNQTPATEQNEADEADDLAKNEEEQSQQSQVDLEKEAASLKTTNLAKQILRQLIVDRLQHEAVPYLNPDGKDITNITNNEKVHFEIVLIDAKRNKQTVTIYQQITDENEIVWYPVRSSFRRTVDYLSAGRLAQLLRLATELQEIEKTEAQLEAVAPAESNAVIDPKKY